MNIVISPEQIGLAVCGLTAGWLGQDKKKADVNMHHSLGSVDRYSGYPARSSLNNG